MSEDFVSLHKVIDLVAIRVPVSTEEVDPFADEPVNNSAFAKMLARSHVLSCFKSARASIALLQLFFSKENSISWLERTEAGFAVLSDVAPQEGQEILLNYSRGEKQFKAWVKAGRKQADSSEVSLALPQLPRSMFIGFSKKQVIELLDDAKIDHNLVKDENASAVNVPLISGSSDNPAQATSVVVAKTKQRRFNGPMGEPLALAFKMASDPSSWRSVWAALVVLAKSDQKPYPVTGYSDTEGVKYELKGVDRSFTQHDVASRVRTRTIKTDTSKEKVSVLTQSNRA